MDIRSLAKTRAECALHLHTLGKMNTSPDWDKRVADTAAYALAEAAYQRAEADYQRALSTLTTDELIALSRATDGAVGP